MYYLPLKIFHTTGNESCRLYISIFGSAAMRNHLHGYRYRAFPRDFQGGDTLLASNFPVLEQSAKIFVDKSSRNIRENCIMGICLSFSIVFIFFNTFNILYNP